MAPQRKGGEKTEKKQIIKHYRNKEGEKLNKQITKHYQNKGMKNLKKNKQTTKHYGR
jgi:hypothetical protein